MIEKIFRWSLFCAGIITGIFAGYMIYVDNLAGGAVWLAMAVGFLCFSTKVQPDNDEKSNEIDDEQNNKDLHDMAVLISEIALMSLKNIGRTVPPSSKEIQDMEDKLNNFLDAMPVEKSEREMINEDFERLRERTRRNESGRAILRSSRL